MSLLKQKIEHHVQEEEDEIFKQVREVMDKDELEQIGEEMKALFTEQMSGEPTASLMADDSDDASESHSSRV